MQQEAEFESALERGLGKIYKTGHHEHIQRVLETVAIKELIPEKRAETEKKCKDDTAPFTYQSSIFRPEVYSFL